MASRAIMSQTGPRSKNKEISVVPRVEDLDIIGYNMTSNNQFICIDEYIGLCLRSIETPTSPSSTPEEQRKFIERMCKDSTDLKRTFREVGLVLRAHAPELWKFERIYERVKNRTAKGEELFENLGEPPKSIIMDMSLDILAMVFEHLDFMDKLTLRKTCTFLRGYIVITPEDCSVVTVIFNPKKITVDISGETVTYTPEQVEYKKKCKRIMTPWEDQACSDITSLLKTAGLQLANLNIRFQIEDNQESYVDHAFEKLRRALNTLKPYRIHVENLEIQCCNARHVTSVLRHLKPGILEKMHLNYPKTGIREGLGKIEMKNIFILEQWAALKHVVVERLEVKPEDIQEFYVLPFFEALIEKTSVKTVIRIRNDLIPRPSFIACTLKFTKSLRGFGQLRRIDDILRDSDPNMVSITSAKEGATEFFDRSHAPFVVVAPQRRPQIWHGWPYNFRE